MLKPNRKDYATHQEWVAATQKWNASKPKRKDYKTYSEWVNAIDAWNKKQRDLKNSKKTDKKDKPVIKSVGKTDYNVSTESGKKAYEEALKKSKENNTKDDNLKKKYKQVSGEELKLKIKEIKEQTNKKKKVNVENNEKEKKVVVEDNKQNEEKKKKVVVEDKKDKLKVSKFIRNPKTKTLVRRTSQKGKQLLKLQERIKKRNKRLFGK